ncbi:MAG: hypothetical protein JW951_07640, partial [Lentisphaerae bacterium]|nr:hypothetical protein [Lentisphaerota bacterium]
SVGDVITWEFTDTDFLNAWIAHPEDNAGFLVRPVGIAGYDEYRFHSTRAAVKEDRPAFEVDLEGYRPPLQYYLEYDLPAPAKVSILVRNSSGEVVRELLHGADRAAGYHLEPWNRKDDQGAYVSTNDTYTWELLRSEGLQSEFLMNLGVNIGLPELGADEWPGNHVPPYSVAVDTNHHVTLMAGLSEGPAWAVQMDATGNRIWTSEGRLFPEKAVAMGVDDGKIYILREYGRIQVMDTEPDGPVLSECLAEWDYHYTESEAEYTDGMDMDVRGGRLLVSSEGDLVVNRLSTADGHVIETMPTPYPPRGVAIDNNGDGLYICGENVYRFPFGYGVAQDFETNTVAPFIRTPNSELATPLLFPKGQCVGLAAVDAVSHSIEYENLDPGDAISAGAWVLDGDAEHNPGRAAAAVDVLLYDAGGSHVRTLSATGGDDDQQWHALAFAGTVQSNEKKAVFRWRSIWNQEPVYFDGIHAEIDGSVVYTNNFDEETVGLFERVSGDVPPEPSPVAESCYPNGYVGRLGSNQTFSVTLNDLSPGDVLRSSAFILDGATNAHPNRSAAMIDFVMKDAQGVHTRTVSRHGGNDDQQWHFLENVATVQSNEVTAVVRWRSIWNQDPVYFDRLKLTRHAVVISGLHNAVCSETFESGAFGVFEHVRATEPSAPTPVPGSSYVGRLGSNATYSITLNDLEPGDVLQGSAYILDDATAVDPGLHAFTLDFVMKDAQGSDTRVVALPGGSDDQQWHFIENAVTVQSNEVTAVVRWRSIWNQDPVYVDDLRLTATGRGARKASPRRLAVDPADGDIYVLCDGETQQVLRYNAQGVLQQTLFAYGGRCRDGAYDRDNLADPTDIAVAPDGSFWLTEPLTEPRRTVHFSSNGTHLAEFYGGHDYAASGFADPDDPSRVFVCAHNRHGPDYAMTEYQVDYSNRTSSVTAVYRYARNPLTDGQSFGNPRFQIRRYNGCTFFCEDEYPVVYRLDASNAAFTAVAVCGKARQSNTWQIPEAFRPGGTQPENLMFAWADHDGDGAVQSNEITFTEGRFESSVQNSRSAHISDNLTYIGPYPDRTQPVEVRDYEGPASMAPVSWTGQGTPVYHWTNRVVLNDGIPATFRFPDTCGYKQDADGCIYGGYNERDPSIANGIGDQFWCSSVGGTLLVKWRTDGEIDWVVGRHSRSTGCAPGEMRYIWRLLGPVHDCIVVQDVNQSLSHVYHEDGLYVGRLLDNPAAGTPPEAYRLCGENFSGRLHRISDDAVYYYGGGGNKVQVFKVSGFGSIRRSFGDVFLRHPGTLLILR